MGLTWLNACVVPLTDTLSIREYLQFTHHFKFFNFFEKVNFNQLLSILVNHGQTNLQISSNQLHSNVSSFKFSPEGEGWWLHHWTSLHLSNMASNLNIMSYSLGASNHLWHLCFPYLASYVIHLINLITFLFIVWWIGIGEF